MGLFSGMLFGIVLVYVFRAKWSSFPSSVFVISFCIGLLLIFTLDSLILRVAGKIKKVIVVVGQVKNNYTIQNDACIEKKEVKSIGELAKYNDIDEIIICEKINDEKNFNLLIYLLQKLKTEILFVPELYGELLSENFNGITTSQFVATFFGKKSDIEESLIKAMDIAISLIMLIMTFPLLVLTSILIKISSPGLIFYAQKRAGKNGKIFTMYKFRTMINDAEKTSGLSPATENDFRITGIGRFLRKTRLDELPQLWNVLKGEMSLVGPRPENLYRVKTHKALQGLRLAVKPGMTGLAQIRSFYDLHPKHKIKYDFLYIQRRSLLLNLYILMKTVPVVFSKKGW